MYFVLGGEEKRLKTGKYSYNAVPYLDKLSKEIVENIEGSVQFLHDRLAKGESIYGE